MAEVEVTWNGLTLGLDPFRVNLLTGWVELPGASYESGLGAADHGVSASSGVQSPRFPQVSGWINTEHTSRDSAVALLQEALVPRAASDPTVDDLVVKFGGRTQTADAQLARWAVSSDPKSWFSPWVPFLVQWRCPDPGKYDSWRQTTSPLYAPTLGVVKPAAKPFTKTAKPLGGQVTMWNPGTWRDGSPTVITLTGAQSGDVGVDVNGRLVTFALALAADRGDGSPDQLVIDTALGGAWLNGEYRPVKPGSDLIAALRLRPGANVITALGSAGAGTPSMTVAVRPKSW